MKGTCKNLEDIIQHHKASVICNLTRKPCKGYEECEEYQEEEDNFIENPDNERV